MTKTPRASLSITLLDDEDFCLLMDQDGGPEAFGVFVALVLAGRERYQQNKAKKPDDGDALIFTNHLAHVLHRAHLRRDQLDRCLALLKTVAEMTGSAPWAYLDEMSQLVIRSFFKYNMSPNWGGARTNAGRAKKASKAKPKPTPEIQDEFKLNSSRSKMESSCGVAVSVSDSVSVSVSNETIPPQSPPTTTKPVSVTVRVTDPDDIPFVPPTDHPATLPMPGAGPLGAIGANSASDVARVMDECARLYPTEGVAHWARGWLADHPASRVIEAIHLANDKQAARPSRYIAGILRNPSRSPSKASVGTGTSNLPWITPEETERLMRALPML